MSFLIHTYCRALWFLPITLYDFFISSLYCTTNFQRVSIENSTQTTLGLIWALESCTFFIFYVPILKIPEYRFQLLIILYLLPSAVMFRYYQIYDVNIFFADLNMRCLWQAFFSSSGHHPWTAKTYEPPWPLYNTMKKSFF